jgi:prepilin-type processing-associated H-X9-DG protein
MRLACANNFKQIGIALHSFHDTNGRFPPLRTSRSSADPNSHLSWMALILPQMGEENLYQVSVAACAQDANPLDNPPHTALAEVVKSYVCPADGRLGIALTDQFGVTAGFTSYIGIDGVLPPGAAIGLDGVLGGIPGRRLADITDGASNTLLAGERPPPDSLQAGWWYPGPHAYAQGLRGPNNAFVIGGGVIFVDNDPCVAVRGTFGPGAIGNPCDRFHLWSLHPGGANFLFADGSERFLSYSAEPLMMSLGSRSGGEIIELP